MNKKRFHHFWRYAKHLKPSYFLVLALVAGIVCVLALRANNQHMVQLRDQLYAADKSDGDVQGALTKLQAYVIAHMNTNLSAGPNPVYPPIQLKYTYDRLVQARSSQTGESNLQIYTDAQHYCEGQNSTDFSGRNRVPCIEQYVKTHTTTQTEIPDALYKFDFVTPKWSPDLAGWSLVVAVVCGLIGVLGLLFSLIFKRLLR